MRGRLMQRFKAKVARLDTVETEEAGNYDPDFREVKNVDSSGDGIGAPGRVEHIEVMIPCQVANPRWEALRSTDLGNVPQTGVTLYFHFSDLERLGLVDETTGESLLHVGDRLVSIHDYTTEATVQVVRTPPGLYVTEATPSGWGICMARPTRNLLKVTFAERSAVP